MPAGNRGIYHSGAWWPDDWRSTDLRPHQDAINRMIANAKRATDRYTIRQPVKWSTTIDAMPTYSREMLELYYGIDVKPDAWGNWAVELPGSKSTFNERSKPMGLTTSHKYTDNDGDYIEVKPAGEDRGDPSNALAVIDTGPGVYDAYVTSEYSIPLALNVLGYDRPSAKPYAAGPTKYRDATANEAIPGSQIARDTNIAKAIDLLIGADIYDQRVAANKAADEVKAAKEAKAKRDAELNAELAATKRKLRNLSETVADFGVTAIRAEEIAEAAAKYKAAFEAHAGI